MESNMSREKIIVALDVDSVEKAVSAILQTRGEDLTEDELGSLSRLIDEFLKGGKG